MGSFVGEWGTFSSKAPSGPLVQFTNGFACAVDDLIVCWVETPTATVPTAVDNDTTSDVFTRIDGISNGTTLRLELWACKITQAISVNAAFFQVHWASTPANCCVTFQHYRGYDITASDGVPQHSVNNITTFSIASNGSVSAGALVVAAGAMAGPTGDTFPADADSAGGDTWHVNTRTGTTGGSATTNRTLNSAYKLPTSAASQTWNNTLGTARTWAAIIAAFAPAVSGSNWTATPADGAGVTDSVALVMNYAPTIPDAAGVTDTVAKLWAAVLTPGDTAGITDSIAAGLAVTASIADPAGIADALAAVEGFNVNPADGAGITDALAAAFARTLADGAGITDALASVVAYLRSIGVGSVIGQSVGGVKLGEDLIAWDAGQSFTIDLDFSVTDASGVGMPILGVAGGSVALGASAVNGHVPAIYVGLDRRLRVSTFWHSATGADPGLLVGGVGDYDDGVQRHLTVTYDGTTQRSYIDGVLIQTWTVPQTTFNAVYSYFAGAARGSGWESYPTGDANFWAYLPAGCGVANATFRSGVQSPLPGASGDGLSITDALAAGLAFVVSPGDGAGVTDALASLAAYLRSVADPAGITDAAQTVEGFNVAPADTAGITDSANAGLLATRAVNDAAGITDNTALVEAFAVSLADSGALTDLAATVEAFSRALADAAGATDSASPQAAYTRALADPAGITDALASVEGYNAALADAAGITDVAAALVAYLRTVADPVAATDASALAFATVLSDAAGITDLLASTASYLRTIADPVAGTDNVTTQGSGALSQSFNDGAALTDVLASQAGYTRAVSDPAGITDALAQALAFVLADTGALTDNTALTRNTFAVLADTGALTDALANVNGTFRIVADSGALTDAAALAKGTALSVADAAALIDALAHDSNYALAIADSADIADNLDAAAAVLLALADSAALTDGATPLLFFGGLTRWLTVLVTDSALAVVALTAERMQSLLLGDEELAAVALHAEKADTVRVDDTAAGIQLLTERDST